MRVKLAIKPEKADWGVYLPAKRSLHSNLAFDKMKTRKRSSRMWTMGVRSRCAGLALLACLSIVITLESDSSQAAETPQVQMASLAVQAGKKTANPPNVPSPQPVSDDYIIGPSDVLAINVWKDAELSRTVPVRPDGKISLPLIGELQVNGLTALKVQRMVAERLKEYISNPEVTVIVQDVKSRTYVVLGKVAKPGSFELGKPTTVLEAIAVAGGFLDFAKTSKIYIIRPTAKGPSETLHFDYKQVIKGRNPEQNVELKSGDTIIVP
jgi:polysaccharide export outer membrane protein